MIMAAASSWRQHDYTTCINLRDSMIMAAASSWRQHHHGGSIIMAAA
jgi:hypothetical protein